jgi:hypothetical protein
MANDLAWLTPAIHEALEGAEPLTPVRRYRATENRRHYERLSRMPDNFLMTGDVAFAFNPVYGQGMTTAALGAEAVEACLLERGVAKGGVLTGLSKRFQGKLAKVNTAPWILAKGEDYRYRGTEGGTPDRTTRFMHRYMDRVMDLSTMDAGVRLRLLNAFNLIEPPTTLFRSSLAAMVLRREVSRHRRATALPAGRELPGAAQGSPPPVPRNFAGLRSLCRSPQSYRCPPSPLGLTSLARQKGEPRRRTGEM